MSETPQDEGASDEAPQQEEPATMAMPPSDGEGLGAEQEEPQTREFEPAASRPKRLVRSHDDRVIAGVCGGLGEYFGVDSVLIRIAALVLVFAGGAGILLYIIGWIAMPDDYEQAPDEGSEPAGEPARAAPPERARGPVLLGLAFVVLGVFFLVDEIWPDFLSWQYIWPVALIGIGIAILARARR